MNSRKARHNAECLGLLPARSGLKQWREIKERRSRNARRPMATMER